MQTEDNLYEKTKPKDILIQLGILAWVNLRVVTFVLYLDCQKKLIDFF